MIPTREVHAGDWVVRLDLSRQALRVDVSEDDWDGGRKPRGRPVSPVLKIDDGPVSAATLLLKAKQFDDGLYAAVELAAQQGAGRFPGKAVLLSSLAATLAAGLPGKGTGAATAIHAACALGGIPATVPEALVEAVRTAKAGFTAKADFVCKPLGFYTWTDQLRAIFLQDRFLQQPLELDTAAELARAVKNTPGASVACDACLRLHNRLTNPPKSQTFGTPAKQCPFSRLRAHMKLPCSNGSTKARQFPMGSTSWAS